MAELSELMAEYKKVAKEIKDLEVIKDNLRTQLLTVLKTLDIDEYEDGIFKVKYSMLSKNVLDKEALKEFLKSHLRTIEEFNVSSEYEMIKVTEV